MGFSMSGVMGASLSCYCCAMRLGVAECIGRPPGYMPLRQHARCFTFALGGAWSGSSGAVDNVQQ
jgi:hypothetical protein